MAKQNNNPPAVDTQKKDEGAKKKIEREKAVTELVKLSGKDVLKMTDAERDQLLIIIGQLLGLVNDKGKVK